MQSMFGQQCLVDASSAWSADVTLYPVCCIAVSLLLHFLAVAVVVCVWVLLCRHGTRISIAMYFCLVAMDGIDEETQYTRGTFPRPSLVEMCPRRMFGDQVGQGCCLDNFVPANGSGPGGPSLVRGRHYYTTTCSGPSSSRLSCVCVCVCVCVTI